jgi:hypothetical protein
LFPIVWLTLSRPGTSLTTSDVPRRRASSEGAPNFSGIANPAIDALIAKAIAANDRDSLNVTCRAIDRVLRAEYYWVAGWYKPAHWIWAWKIEGPALADVPTLGFLSEHTRLPGVCLLGAARPVPRSPHP